MVKRVLALLGVFTALGLVMGIVRPSRPRDRRRHATQREQVLLLR